MRLFTDLVKSNPCKVVGTTQTEAMFELVANWLFGSPLTFWAPLSSLVAVPILWNRCSRSRLWWATFWFFCSGLCFWWGGGLAWGLRDGFGIGAIETHGQEAFDASIKPLLFFNALFSLCFMLGSACVVVKPRSSR